MQFAEIGQQLRAYRLESGLSAEEIAARMGVSRAALYRYEKGEVIKLDTIQRLAGLLKIPPLSLLGIGMEYYNRPVGYQERTRQIEETADQLLMLAGPTAYAVTSDSYDSALSAAWGDALEHNGASVDAARAGPAQIMAILSERKRLYHQRKHNIVAMVTAGSLTRFLECGVGGGIHTLSQRTRCQCEEAALLEIERLAQMMETEPMGLQFGLLPFAVPSGSFVIARGRNTATLTVNPFPEDTHPAAAPGAAMVTAADDAVAAHQHVAQTYWQQAVKGAKAAGMIRQMIVDHRTARAGFKQTDMAA